jgi:hypothetical protein
MKTMLQFSINPGTAQTGHGQVWLHHNCLSTQFLVQRYSFAIYDVVIHRYC